MPRGCVCWSRAHGAACWRIAHPPTGLLSLRFLLDAPHLEAAYATGDGGWQTIADDLDLSLLSVDTAGGFIGNTFGPYALRSEDGSAGAE